MRIFAIFCALLVWSFEASAQPQGGALEFDHVWIVVSPGAPEREAFERAGFRVAPARPREGLGVSSVSIELLNAAIELVWVDPSVPVARGNEQFVERLRSGASPIAVALRRTAGSADRLPFESWPVTTPSGMIEVLTPRAQTKAVNVFVVPHAIARSEAAAAEAIANNTLPAALYQHPNGAQRITKVSIAAPSRALLPTVAQKIGDANLEFVEGPEWLVEITLDGGMKTRSRDFGPALPLVIHF